MRPVSTFLFYIWAGAAVVFGLVGVVFAGWELPIAFGLDVDAGAPDGSATFLNQYRFLRGVECGVGVLMLILRREMLSDPRYGWLFVVVVLAGATGRLVGLILDGMPPAWMLVLLAVEAAAAAAMALHLRALSASMP